MDKKNKIIVKGISKAENEEFKNSRPIFDFGKSLKKIKDDKFRKKLLKRYSNKKLK